MGTGDFRVCYGGNPRISESALKSKRKLSPLPANPLGQLLDVLQRRAKTHGRRPANNVLTEGPNLEEVALLARYTNPSPPLAVEAPPRCEDLNDQPSHGKCRNESFVQDVLVPRVGEIVTLNKEGITIFIPSNPNQSVRWRHSSRK
jgi:hypothetical protein